MGEEGKKIAQMARKFEALNPGVTVETQAIPWDAAHAKLLTSVVGGIPPDVSQMGTTWMAEFAAMEALAPLDDAAARSKTASPDAFFPGSLQTCRVDGVLYGVPWYVDTRVLFYRKDLLREAGFPSPPATWEEFKAASRKLAARKGPDGRALFGMAYGARSWNDLLMAVWQNGGDPLRPSAPEYVQAMTHYVSFFREGLSPTKEAADVDLFHAFRTGYMPMFVSGPWMVELTRKELPELEGQWGVAMLPGRKSRTSFVGGSNLVVFKDSRRQELAWRFLEFMSDPANQVEWFRITTDLPSARAAWEDPLLKSQPMIRVFGEQMYDTASPPTIAEWEQIARATEDAMEKIVLNPADDRRMRERLLLLEADIQRIRLQNRPEPGSWTRVTRLTAVIGGLAGLLLFLRWRRRHREAAGRPGAEPLGLALRRAVPGYLFVLPSVLLLLVFLFVPLAVSFLMSLTDLNVFSINQWNRINFVGLENYLKTVQDPLFWKSLWNTLYFAGIGVPLTIAVSLAAAVALNQKVVRLKPFFRVSLFAPVVTTVVAVAVVWRWLYNPDFGPFNWFLRSFGFEPLHWLSDPRTAMPSLILMAVWKNFGYNMVIFLAGLQTIPETQYEAARIDGANGWQCFRYITVPGLAPTTVFVVVLTTIGYLQFFAEPYVMTKGGPLNSTMSIVLYLYDQGFRFFNLGYASAISYMLFGLILAFTLLQLQLRKSGYEPGQ
jgi:ABC-type sugar transport system permease subunit/ABC-type glycerol-3-phosphate transport system substrate-binding protein